jgi:hypothetical protein
VGFGGDPRPEFKETLEDTDGVLKRCAERVGEGGSELAISVCLAIAETLALTLPCMTEEPVSSRADVG